MELANQSRDDVAVFRVVGVTRAIEVGGHRGEVFGAVLPVIAPAHFDAGDLGKRVRAVSRFERASKEVFFLHRLWGMLRVDATGAEKHQSLDIVLPGGVDNVGLNGEVVADKFGWVGVVGVDAADLGSSEEDVVGFFLGEENVRGGLVGQVEFAVGSRQEVAVILRLEVAQDGRTD